MAPDKWWVTFNWRTKTALVSLSMALLMIALQLTWADKAISADEQLVLTLDKKQGARVIHHGIPVFESVGGFFEYYTRNINGKRNRIVSGPWKGLLAGHLEKKGSDLYVLSGNTEDNAIRFASTYEKIDSQTLEFTIDFLSFKKSAHFAYEIIKLNGEIFKGAGLSGVPRMDDDPHTLPYNPMPIDKRGLLKKKNSIRISSLICDIEIKDLQNSSSIILSDLRSAPWDRKQSFYFSGNTNSLEPGKKYRFKYRLRVFKPSKMLDATESPRSPHFPRNLNFSDSPHSQQLLSDNRPNRFFSIPCKKELLENKNTLFSDDIILYTNYQNEVDNEILINRLSSFTDKEIVSKQLAGNNFPEAGIILTGPGKLLNGRNQSFAISIEPKRIILCGSDALGRLYAVYKLLTLVEPKQKGMMVPLGEFYDWPDIQTRGMMIELLPPARKDMDLFKKYIDALSMARVNMIIFWHRPQDLLEWENDKKSELWTKSQIAEIASYARRLNMDVWGGMVSKFKPEHFPELDIAAGSNFYNPFKDRSYDTLFGLYGEIIDAYSPSGILIGHDEIQGLSIYSKASGVPPYEILSDSVNTIQKWMASKNLKTMMAGDMLLDSEKWKEHISGGVNSGNPLYNSGDTYKAADLINKNVMVFDWHYNKAEEYRTLKYFSDKGFEVFGCTWHDPEASCIMARDVKRYETSGIIGTDFGFWRTLSPAATTLYSPVCGWAGQNIYQGGNEDVTALADALRDNAGRDLSFDQKPYSLTPYANESTTDSFAGDGNGFFDLGPYADLRNLQSGRINAGGIKFDTMAGIGEDLNNCLVVGLDRNGNPDPEDKICIAFKGKKVKALAFLHSCYVEKPNYNHKYLGQYLVEYSTGHQEEIDIIQNWNITDLRSSPSIRHNSWTFKRKPEIVIGSELAWDGLSAIGGALNLQKYFWLNPYPDISIKKVTLIAKKNGQKRKIGLLGLTLLD